LSSFPSWFRGEFTSELSRLGVGDTLLVDRQAYGYLTLDRFVDGRDLWLLSTGTGWRRFCRSCRTSRSGKNSNGSSWSTACVRPGAGLSGPYRGLAQREYLAEFAHKLQLINTVTREQHPGALNGRITTLIENGELERAAGWP
jgi:ferredoxin--NADP+ reductase